MCEAKGYTWFDAQEICSRNNSVLTRKAVHNSSDYFWIGNYRRKSTWIKISGCYPGRVLQTFSMSYDMKQLPFAGFCQEICLSFKKTVFAIKGSECKCLQNPFNLNEELPSDTCNVSCNIGADAHYFDECGGQRAYSVFQSVMENNQYSKSESFCIGIHCTEFPEFYFEKDCNRRYPPLCQSYIPEKRQFEPWSDAMKYCKSGNSSSYLFSNVFLNDINRTCILINSVFTEPSWLGVAAELYSGIDRGNEIEKEEEKYYHQCMKCKGPNDCTHELCSEQLTERVHCMEIDNPARHGTEKDLHSASQNSGIRNCKPKGENNASSPNDQDKPKEESNVYKIVIPVVVVVTCLIGGCSAIFLILRKRTQKQSAKTTKSRNSEEGCKNPESNKDVTENHDYFTLGSQEKCTKISNARNMDFEHQCKDNTYDHLRGKNAGTEVANRESDYDTASKTAKQECHSTRNTEENYDHLREKIVNNEDNINSAYSHIAPHASEQSDYDVASRIKNTEISSIYSHPNSNQRHQGVGPPATLTFNAEH
ncbi:uncharacterized protein LOC134265555 isoform X2 [Saccostrea cucullata]|uniref:uncharacterized protein LOC134265555 isoform X2 n=1 Tax=Saccostrea cuccullata TaxID=36930 RepID=UPI002ED3ED8F